jgi:PhnB protein
MAEPTMGPTSGVTPYLTIKDGAASAAVAFYVRAFGATEVFRHPADDGKRLLHAHLLINGASVMLSDDFPEYRDGLPAGDPSGVTLHLQVADADVVWNQALAAGAVEVLALADQFWGDRYGKIRDPFGHGWSIASRSKTA